MAPLKAVRDSKHIDKHWQSPRWKGVRRDYTSDDVLRLRGSIEIKYTLAEMGAERLWQLLHSEPHVSSLGALTGSQAVQQVRAGLKAIYRSGWQVAADANLAGHMYPDQSLYPSNSVPSVVKRINQALQRADQIDHLEGRSGTHWFAPIIADAEAGFGGALNAFELMKAMIEAGAAAVHFEDQLASEKKCGHLGGKVLVPVSQFIRTLASARLAADVMGVPTLVVARTDAHSATLITSDVDERDREFITGERTPEGFFRINNGLKMAIARAIAYAPYADVLWCETSTPDIDEAREFAEGVHAVYPGKLLAYNCSPSRSEEHTSELQSLAYLVCRLLLEKKKHTDHTSLSQHTNSSNYLAYTPHHSHVDLVPLLRYLHIRTHLLSLIQPLQIN